MALAMLADISIHEKTNIILAMMEFYYFFLTGINVVVSVWVMFGKMLPSLLSVCNLLFVVEVKK